jgi:hypothetical protein
MKSYEFYNQESLNNEFSHLLSRESQEYADCNLNDPLKIFTIKRESNIADPKRRYSESEFFSMFSISDNSFDCEQPASDKQNQTIYRRIFNNFFMEKQVISEKLFFVLNDLFMKIVNYNSENDDNERLALIREIHGDNCLESLFSIAGNCLEILFKSFDNGTYSFCFLLKLLAVFSRKYLNN